MSVLLERAQQTWQTLQQAQPTFHALLHFHVEHPDLPSAEMAERLAMHLLNVSDRAVNDLWSPLRVTFDRAVEPLRLVSAFSIVPAAAGVWQVSGREARYVPTEPWTSGLTYDWALDTSLVATDGTRLPARFDARFRTVAYSTGVTVPAGYVADRIARQNLTAPEGILPAPWIGPDAMILALPAHRGRRPRALPRRLALDEARGAGADGRRGPGAGGRGRSVRGRRGSDDDTGDRRRGADHGRCAGGRR